MANCSQCGKEVSCGCNLINGDCLTCFSKNQAEDSTPQKIKKSSQRVVYSNKSNPLPNTEFEKILKTAGLSKESKIKRINDILEKARQELL